MRAHLEQAQRPADHLPGIFILELDAQTGEELGHGATELDRHFGVRVGHAYSLTSPRAKIEATKLSTSVAQISQ